MSQEPNAPSLRVWNSDDYPLLCEWWLKHSRDTIPAAILPKTGYVLERDGKPTCAMFVYLTVDLGVATFRWSVSEPGKTMTQSLYDFELLFEGVKKILSALDYHVYFADAPPAIARVMKRLGFSSCSRGNEFLIMPSSPQ